MNEAAEALAERIRALIGGREDISERRMFGGVAFMMNGNMLVGPLKTGALAARVGRDAYDDALDLPGAGPMTFTGRAMRGFVEVAPKALASDDALAAWIGRAEAFVSTLPAK